MEWVFVELTAATETAEAITRVFKQEEKRVQDRASEVQVVALKAYQQAILRPDQQEHLRYRPAPDRRSVGEIAAHIAFGRLDWFYRMGAPGAAELVAQEAPWWQPWQEINPAIAESTTDIIHWLQASWEMIETNLNQWTVADLSWTYRQPYGGKVYVISRQWVIWRIMAHDIHHGGQLSLLLAAQGIELPELGDNGGHIVEVSLETLET